MRPGFWDARNRGQHTEGIGAGETGAERQEPERQGPERQGPADGVAARGCVNGRGPQAKRRGRDRAVGPYRSAGPLPAGDSPTAEHQARRVRGRKPSYAEI